ncbi:MAG: hypothetical protein H6582_12420 [Crocinitomicaceae bacterium]|nr:hypothetical protein [Crocinitomicaceae bacterium]
MRSTILFLMLFSSGYGLSQPNLPVLGSFHYQNDYPEKEMFGYYVSDTRFVLIVMDNIKEESYRLSGKMKFYKNTVSLQYLEIEAGHFSGFEVGKEETLIIERHGEILVPTGEPFVICHYLEKAQVRY